MSHLGTCQSLLWPLAGTSAATLNTAISWVRRERISVGGKVGLVNYLLAQVCHIPYGFTTYPYFAVYNAQLFAQIFEGK